MKRKRNPILTIFWITAIICCVLLVVAVIIWCTDSADHGMGTAATIVASIGGSGMGLDLIAYLSYCMFSSAKVEEREEIQRECKEQQEKIQEFENWKIQNIKKTVIVSATAKKDKGNAMKRGVVGGLLFGVAGSVIGSATAHENVFTTFLVIYTDDSREIVEVKNESEQYNFYIKYLEV